jgi:acetyl esterase/lipase
MIKFLMQNRHILSGHLRKETIDWSTYEAVLAFRRQVEDGAGKFGKLSDGMEVKPVDIGGMYAEWLIPRGADQEKVIFYCHGGGYVSGTCHAHRAIVAKFVQKSGMQALLFEYRLAPEHPYPAAVEDAVAAYCWLLDQELIPSNIVFLGDSAGGGLCLAALLALRDRGIPLPAGAAVYSPVTDYTCSGESYRTKAKCVLRPGYRSRLRPALCR